jgi:hypothetical protein
VRRFIAHDQHPLAPKARRQSTHQTHTTIQVLFAGATMLSFSAVL